MSKKTLYDIYRNIMEGCYKENSFTYHSYGGKGIKVCEEWHDREKFYEWCKQNGWKIGLTIKRIDNTKDFEPDNCYIDTLQCKKVPEITKRELCFAVLGTKLSNHPLANIYAGMKARCYVEGASHFQNYGGRGIKISNEWLGKYGIIKFIIWSLENGWEDGLSIDRIDNNRGYSPDNCRWIPLSEQPKNRTNVVLYEYDGKFVSLSEASRMAGVGYDALRNKMKLGVRLETAIEELLVEKEKRDAEREERKKIKEKQRKLKDTLTSDIYFSNGAVNYSAVGRKYGISGRDTKLLVKSGLTLSEAIARLRQKRNFENPPSIA